jgi:nicotinic acid mononucleotide adenylyltransferase
LELCHIVVFARPGSHSSSVDAPFHPSRFTWIDLDLPLSSTECREAIASKHTAGFLQLPTKISDYIQENHLYGY